MQFASWNSERGARGLGSMPSSAIDIQGDLGGVGNDLTASCPVAVTLGDIANTEVYKFFADFWQMIA